jgi:peptidoglycan/LPS O-acetylase OafA/YrhL
VTYRPDIDGLRALAVVLVLGFHAFPHRVPGGFVGVDVFFVISGFLITGLLRGRIGQGEFSIAEFYARRCRRICRRSASC